MRDDEPYKATVEDRSLITGHDEAPLAAVATTLAEAATLIWTDLDLALAHAGVPGARRVPASSHAAAVSMFPRLTTVLGTGAVMLYEHDASPDVTVVAAATPVIVLGPRLSSGKDLPPGAIRALLARAVELTRPEHLAFAGLPAREATRLVTSIARLFGPATLRDAVSALMTEEDEGVQRAHDDMVKAAMPVKVRSRLEAVLAPLSPAALDTARYVAACHRDADRAALLVGGDAGVIAEGAKARGETLAYLVRAIGQPGWLATRAKLGVGVR
jgi:hypothetical protein